MSLMIKKYLMKNPVKVTATRVSRNPNMDSNDMDHWRCLLTKGTAQATVYFSKGYGHHGQPPDAAEILECLLDDEGAYRNSEGPEDLVESLGIKAAEARKCWKAMEKAHGQLESLLSYDLDALVKGEYGAGSWEIREHGMGGFLCPPGHPMLTKSLDLAPDSSLALDSAAEHDWVPGNAKIACAQLIREWEETKRPLTDTDVQDWIHQVLGYFRTSYRSINRLDKTGEPIPEGRMWHAENRTFDEDRSPVLWQDDHAGVHCIRKYYPEYVATAEDFAQAYWGKKPEENR